MCRLGRIGSGHLPILLLVLMIVTLTFTYVLAVLRKDVDPLFPYISTTATKRPESCIFGQMLNIGALLVVIVVYLRYRLVKELNRGADQRLRKMNLIALAFGLLSAFGMSMVANFQETSVLVAHLVGAFTCFGCGVVYGVIQTSITYRMYPLYNGLRIVWIRAFICAVALLSFVASTALGPIAGKQYRDANPGKGIPIPWNRDDAGWLLHTISAAFEWVLALSFGAFQLTFSRDFEKLRIGVAVEPLVQHLDESPVARSYQQSDRDPIFNVA